MVDQERVDLWGLSRRGASAPVTFPLTLRAWFTHSFNTQAIQRHFQLHAFNNRILLTAFLLRRFIKAHHTK